MENNFDKHIKDQMKDYEAEYKASDWNLMEQKMDEQANLNPEIEDVYLDGIAFENLHNLEEAYNPNHWALMREKLDASYAFRRKLMRYKVLEVALVALFIFTLVQYLPLKKKSNHNNLANTNSTEQNIEYSNQVDLAPVLESSSENNDPKIIETLAQENLIVSNTNDLATGTEESDFADDDIIANSDPINDPVNTEAIVQASDFSIAENNPSFEIPSTENVVVAIPEFEDFNLSLFDPLSLKEAEKMAVPHVDELNSHNIFTDLKQPIKIRIGMLLGPDANYVMTPSNQSLGFDVLNQYVVGYTGGLSLGFKYDRLEIETGALYSYVTYGSRNVFEIKGSFAAGGYVQQGLVGAELDIVRLPLNLKYNFYEKGKWNVYAFSGVSANLTVETFYNYITQDVGNSNASRNFADPAIPPEGFPELTPKTYDGVFEGGSFSDNTFFTGNVGFGIERYFTPRMSIFFQPSYNHQFTKGLGPQSDQINSLSILTGAKVTLKKRKKLKK